MTPIAAVIVVYLVVQFGVGVWASRRIRTEDDYLVAGRRLGYPLGIFSIFATWFGAETCIGAAADIAEHGLSVTTAEPFGYGLCVLLMGLIFAAPLWRRKLTTLADLFRERYSVGVERLAAIFLIPTSLFWAAAQVRAFGHVLASVSTLEVEIAIGVAAAVAIAYTAVGGLFADAITDLIQGVALTVGLGILFVFGLIHVGGPADALTVLRALPRPSPEPVSLLETLEAWSIPVLGSVVAVELVSRVVATRSEVVARRSALLAGAAYITVGLIPVFFGLVGAAIVPDLADTEQLLPAVAETLLPGVLYAVFVGALISAMLSTVDSTLLIASGLLSHNLVLPLLPVRSERAKVRLARAAVAGFGIVAYVIALNASSVLGLIEESSAFGSAGTLVIVTFGLFTTVGGSAAALATLLAGMATYIGANLLGAPVPFITSLVAALGAYVCVAAVEHVQGWAPDPARSGATDS